MTTATIGADTHRPAKASNCFDREHRVAIAQAAGHGKPARPAPTPIAVRHVAGCRGEDGCPAASDTDHGPCLCGTFTGGRS